MNWKNKTEGQGDQSNGYCNSPGKKQCFVVGKLQRKADVFERNQGGLIDIP